MPQPLKLGQVNHLAYGPRVASSAATPATRRAGSATAAAPPATCGSTLPATASSAHARAAGQLSCPMWIGERVYFLSDAEGTATLFLPARRQRSRAPHRPCRFLRATRRATAAHRLPVRARLWLYDPASDTTRRWTSGAQPRAQTARRFVPAEAHVGSALHPAGHSLVIETRGKLVTMPLWKARCASPASPTVCATAWGSGWRTAARCWRSAMPAARSGWNCTPTTAACACSTGTSAM